VVHWLRRHGAEPDPELVSAIFERAKRSTRVLAEAEIAAICRDRGVELER
jgi:predicted signal transduction protein with EAL and GGDEF domain